MNFSSSGYEAVRGRLRARFGDRVEPWWEALPAVVTELSDRWRLTVEEPIGRGNTSLVLRCRLVDGRRAVLKLCPDTDIAIAEGRALQTWGPSGHVPVLWGHDAAAGALLMEAIGSESPISAGGREVGLSDVSALIGGLHRAGAPMQAHGAPSLADRIEFIFDLWDRRCRRAPGLTDLVSPACLHRGRLLARRLVADGGAPVLLHGDLHPANVLDGGEQRGLVAIDPRPCVGEAAFDVVDWVFWRATGPASWMCRSEELASGLDLEHERVWAWCRALAALLAAAMAARGGALDESNALLAIAP